MLAARNRKSGEDRPDDGDDPDQDHDGNHPANQPFDHQLYVVIAEPPQTTARRRARFGGSLAARPQLDHEPILHV